LVARGAVILLTVGFVQVYVKRNQCQRRGPLSIAAFWLAVITVLRAPVKTGKVL
jgi:hypothetical protein